MGLTENIKTRITDAMKSGNTLEKDLFRVVLGDIQTQARGGEPNDDMALGVIKKQSASLKETIGYGESGGRDMSKERGELALLEALLPKNWNAEEIEAFFVDAHNPLFEVIRDAKNEGQALGIGMKALKNERAPVDAEEVKKVIAKIRAS